MGGLDLNIPAPRFPNTADERHIAALTVCDQVIRLGIPAVTERRAEAQLLLRMLGLIPEVTDDRATTSHARPDPGGNR